MAIGTDRTFFSFLLFSSGVFPSGAFFRVVFMLSDLLIVFRFAIFLFFVSFFPIFVLATLTTASQALECWEGGRACAERGCWATPVVLEVEGGGRKGESTVVGKASVCVLFRMKLPSVGPLNMHIVLYVLRKKPSKWLRIYGIKIQLHSLLF